MTGKINELLNKIQGFQAGVDYTVSRNSQGTNYMINSRRLARNLRQILTPEPYLSIEGEFVKIEGSYNSGSYYAYQGDASLTSDRLVVGNVGESNPNLLESNFSQTSMPQISEITDEEAHRFGEQGAETVHSPFSPFSSTSRTNDYYRSENRETKQREIENRQRELKEQEEKLAAERKRLEEEMKAETQQSQQQNQSDRQGEQGRGYFPPSAGFWTFVIHILALGGLLL